MGTLLSLGIGNMELDWGKYNVYTDFSKLFQAEDYVEIPYIYQDEEGENKIVMKEGFSKKLSDMKMRLELLGYTIDGCHERYSELLYEHRKHCGEINLSFDTFYSKLISIDASSINMMDLEAGFDNYGCDFGEYGKEYIYKILKLSELLDECSDIRGIYEFLENIDTNIVIRILADNASNANYEVQWRVADAIAEGWIEKEGILKGLNEEDKIMIVTEGSSDTFIISETIKKLYPNISDFFSFVDMEKNYPFTGVGNLYNFCKGLCGIRIQNNIIVIFDNDTAGLEKYKESKKLEKPEDFLILRLPDNSDFENIITIGPQGETKENINGKAVAIECFLDFSSVETEPKIRWVSYSKKEDCYQGALVSKDDYVTAFKKSDLRKGEYDTKKLKQLVDYILKSWLERRKQCGHMR